MLLSPLWLRILRVGTELRRPETAFAEAYLPHGDGEILGCAVYLTDTYTQLGHGGGVGGDQQTSSRVFLVFLSKVHPNIIILIVIPGVHCLKLMCTSLPAIASATPFIG